MRPFFVLIALTACSDRYLTPIAAEPSAGRTVVLHPDTVLLDELAADLWVDEAGVLVTGDVDIELGQVIVGQRDGGYLRHVVGRERVQGGLYLHTAAASLRDAILEAHIHEEIQVTRRAVNHWSFDRVVLADRTVTSGGASAHVVADLDGSWVEFEPVLVVDLDIDEGDDAASIQLGFELRGGTELGVTTTGRLTHTAEKLLFTDAIPFAFSIGPVPVAGTADLSVYGGYRVDAQGLADVGVATEVTAMAEVEAGWRGGDWYTDADADLDVWVEPWTLAEGSADAEVWLRADVGATLYGTTSVTASIRPWMEGQICDLDRWGVDAGVDGAVGFDLTVFGWEVWESDPVSFDGVQIEVISSVHGTCE